MITYEVYKVVHLTGVLMVFMAFGGATIRALTGGPQAPWRKQIAITHGLGLFLSLVGGFGLLARLGLAQGSLPTWAVLKLAIWIVLAGSLGVAARKPARVRVVWSCVILLGASAAYLAGSKPF